MRESNHAFRHAIGVAVAVGILIIPFRAHAQSTAVTHIQTYYQELMPTIQQAGRLSVRERDKRFAPAIASALPHDDDAAWQWARPGEISRQHSGRQSRKPLHDSSWQIRRARSAIIREEGS